MVDLSKKIEFTYEDTDHHRVTTGNLRVSFNHTEDLESISRSRFPDLIDEYTKQDITESIYSLFYGEIRDECQKLSNMIYNTSISGSSYDKRDLFKLLDSIISKTFPPTRS